VARILITSGPTRQYLDPVRYLTNASSGIMGRSLAQAAIDAGHEVVIVTGPVNVEYPSEATIVPIISTEDMLAAAEREFKTCDGLIGVAAPCDYRPVRVEDQKISKTGEPISLHLIETPDVVATLGESQRQWIRRRITWKFLMATARLSCVPRAISWMLQKRFSWRLSSV